MISGKLNTGFAFSVDETALDDLLLFRAMKKADEGDLMAYDTVGERLLGAEQYEALLRHLKNDTGRVSFAAVDRAILEILASFQAGKN